MAIIIPSKSIYKKDNPKVRDNLVDKIEVSAVEITPSNDYETPVYNNGISNGWETQSSYVNDFKLYAHGVSGLQNDVVRSAFVGIKTTNLNNYIITIPKLKDNKYISKFYYGLNEDKKPYIKTNIRYYKYSGTQIVRFIHKNAGNLTTSSPIYPTTEKDLNYSLLDPNYDDKFQTLSIEQIPNENIVVEETTRAIGSIPSLTAKVEGENNTNIGSYNIVYEENDNEIKFSLGFLCGYEKVYGQLDTTTNSLVVYFNELHDYKCTAEKFVPFEVEITIYGNTIGIDLTNKTITIGEGGKPLSFEGNELMQTTNRLNTPINGKSNAIEDLYTSTLNSFRNGKETATIRCSITNYYRYNDDSYVEIDTASDSRKYFKDGMQVVPMVFGADGKDKPMSYYSDGTAKVFNVLSNKIVDDGVPMQELTLQEADK